MRVYERGVSGSLALLYFLFGLMGGGRAAALIGGKPVEWGDFLSVCEAQPARSEAQPARPEAQPAKPEAQPARPEAQPAKSEARPVRPEAHPARSEAQPDQRLSQLASQEKRKKARIGFSAGDGDMVVGA